MKLTSKEQETIKYYDVNSLIWAERHDHNEDNSTFKKQMDQIFKLVPKGKVLEIGSGNGKDAVMLINHFGKDNYVGVDASKGLIELAQKNNPGAIFVNTSVYDLDMIDEKFDCCWVCAMLIHVPKDRIEEALKSVRSKMKVGSYGVFSMLEGAGDMENHRPGRYFTLYTQEEFANILEASGFKIASQDIVDAHQESRWLTYICQVV